MTAALGMGELRSLKRRIREGSGRVAKRRSFSLLTSWDAFNHKACDNKQLHSIKENLIEQDQDPAVTGDSKTERPSQQFQFVSALSHGKYPSSITHTTTFPSGAGIRCTYSKRRQQGSGRATQLRSFTIEFSLPSEVVRHVVEQEDPIMMASPSQQQQLSVSHQTTSKPSTTSSFHPFFLNSGTPIEGIPEWMSMQRNTPLPLGCTLSTSIPISLNAATPSCFAVTPMEGIPEKAMPYLQTTARLARLPGWQTRISAFQKEEDQSASVHPAANGMAEEDMRSEPETAPVYEAPGVEEVEGCSYPSTPLDCLLVKERDEPQGACARYCEVDVQTGLSLGKMEVHEQIGELHERNDMVDGADMDHHHMGDGSAEEDEQQQIIEEDGYLLPEGISGQQLPEELAGTRQQDTRADDEAGPLSGAAKAGPSETIRADTLFVSKGKTTRKHGCDASIRRKSLAGDGLVTDATGARKSTRAHQRPLQYWRGEQVVFGRDHKSLPTIVRVETRTPNPNWPLSNKAAKKQRSRTRP